MTTPQGMLADEITEIYVDTSYGLMVKFAHGGHRRANDNEKAKMLAALRQAAQGRSNTHTRMTPREFRSLPRRWIREGRRPSRKSSDCALRWPTPAIF